MAKGRKEKPDALRAEPRGGQAPGGPFATAEEIGDEFAPPGHVLGAARTIWLEEMPRLRRMGLLKATDLPAFATYCQAAGRYRTACGVIEAKGMTYESESKHGNMVRVRPEVGIVERAERIMRQFMVELGATSASRIRQNSILASRQGNLFPSDTAPPPPVAEKRASPIGLLN